MNYKWGLDWRCGWLCLSGYFVFAFNSLASAQADVNCGLRCLHVASVALGHDGEYQELKELAPTPTSEKGYSLVELRDLADRLGLSTALVETNYERLKARSARQPFACIGWRNDEHFVLLADFRDGQILVVDPPRQRWVDGIVFRQRWGGESLLVSNEPLLAERDLERAGWSVYALVGALLIVVAGTVFCLILKGVPRWLSRG